MKCSNCPAQANEAACSILCSACWRLYAIEGKAVQGRFGIIQMEAEPWPEEVVNEQDELEEAGQLTLFAYSEKDPLL